MSDEKKKVKDLAVELGLSTKEILTVAKDMGIVAAKVAASSLSDSEMSRIRNHFSPAGADKQEVIVRRRRKTEQESPAQDKVETPAAEAAGSPLPDAVKAKTEEPKSTAVNARIVQQPAPTTTSDESSATAEAVSVEADKTGPLPEAEIVPSATASLPEPVVQETVKVEDIPVSDEAAAPAKVESNDTAVQAEEPSFDPGSLATASKEGKARKASSEKVSGDKPARQSEAAPAKTYARVVRPAAFSAEPERGADGQAVSSTPAMSIKPEDGAEGSTDKGRFASPSGAGDTTSQVRVISRPEFRRPEGRNTQDSQPRSDEARRRPDNRPGDRPAGQGQGARPPRDMAPRPGDAPRTDTGQNRGPGRPGGDSQEGARRPGQFAAPGARPSTPPRAAVPGTAGNFPPAGDSEQGRKKRQKGRRTVEFVDSRSKVGDEDIGWSKSSRRKHRKQREPQPMGGTQPIKAAKRKIKVDEFIRVSDLAHQMQLKSGEIIKVLFTLGVMATINQSLDIDTATLVANEFGYEVERVGFSEQDIIDAQQVQSDEDPSDFVTRPPVVTIMGHVDHGKTSLLDAIRTASVATGEAGGITQHIGAYHVKTKKGEIVFLDTPGHEAFTAMRARGAEVTDIVVLVVAADDGVMEQTKEAINHAKAAKVPIMVAVNKIDKEQANLDRVRRELSEQGLVSDEWGGDTTFSYVSAKKRIGLDELLELLALQAEILELKANPKRPAQGHIVEAKLDKGRGSLGTVLIQQGTLRLGDSFVCGVHSGRVRAMFNDQGKKVKEAGPSIPVEVQGFEGVPEAGEEFIVISDEKSARRIAEARTLKQRERELAKESKITLETFLARKADSVEAAVLNLVVKSDVQGSLEAITDALHKLSTDKVRISIIHGGTGAISESDVLLATASNAIIIGFNVRPSVKAKELAEQEKVDTRFYDIIYKLVEEIKSAMEGMLAPVSREVFLGTADVRETFSVPKIGLIAGCHISDGKIIRNSQVRLVRDGVVIHNGKIGSLRRFKDDVREVTKGYECGIGLDNYNDLKVGDVIEAYEIVEEAATL